MMSRLGTYLIATVLASCCFLCSCTKNAPEPVQVPVSEIATPLKIASYSFEVEGDSFTVEKKYRSKVRST